MICGSSKRLLLLGKSIQAFCSGTGSKNRMILLIESGKDPEIIGRGL